MNTRQRDGLVFVDDPDGNPRSYSAAVRVGDLIYTAGQLGADVGGNRVTMEVQSRQALARVIAAVEAAGGGAESIVKVNCYLADLADFPTYDRIYREMLTLDPMPARTSVQIAAFPDPLLLEVDAVAAVRSSESG